MIVPTPDHDLLAAYPASRDSLLLARARGTPAYDALRARLASIPWVEALTPLPLPPSLLAQSPPGHDLDGFGDVAFWDEDTIRLQAYRYSPQLQLNTERRPERLLWSLQTGAVRIEPYPEIAGPAPRPHVRFFSEGWGPVTMDDGTHQRVLPCIPGGSASGQLMRDGIHALVYGTEDEYDGGFVYIVAPDNQIVHQLQTYEPVSYVYESDQHFLVVQGRSGWLWRPESGHRIVQLPPGRLALSPSGALLACLTDRAVQIHQVSALPSGPPPYHLPVRFSPDGRRLVRAQGLYDGFTGQPIADLNHAGSGYLEGGPAMPWFHVGNRYIVSTQSRLRVWDTETGAPLPTSPRRLRFPHWFRLAHSPDGDRLAAARRGRDTATIYALPSDEALRDVPLPANGRDHSTPLQLSADEILSVAPEPTVRSPEGWTLAEAGTWTVFTHTASQTGIALPMRGPWVGNPIDPGVLASKDGVVRLHGSAER